VASTCVPVASIGPTSETTSLVSLGGCRTRFPRRGGVDLLMNSMFVGNFPAACRRT
jgi:hypothetical protein